jgi:uncharacterized protein YjbJ (UPF0337 family)
MGIEERAKATAKNLEGKAQTAKGELTGSEQDKVDGEIKQTEAQIAHQKEDLKDRAKKVIDKV